MLKLVARRLQHTLQMDRRKAEARGLAEEQRRPAAVRERTDASAAGG